jgi:hypothetical protein
LRAPYPERLRALKGAVEELERELKAQWAHPQRA